MDAHIAQKLNQLWEIDDILLEDSQQPPKPNEYDRFMGLVNQKAGLRDYILRETGKVARWSIDGYYLD